LHESSECLVERLLQLLDDSSITVGLRITTLRHIFTKMRSQNAIKASLAFSLVQGKFSVSFCASELYHRFGVSPCSLWPFRSQ